VEKRLERVVLAVRAEETFQHGDGEKGMYESGVI
jgi:hypothetical protein